MDIFILEDDDNRIKIFKEKLKEHKLDIFKDVNDDSIKAIQDNLYGVIFLDHDLGGKVYVDSQEENTGFQMCRYLNKGRNNDSQIIIHSHNPVGAINIFNALRSRNKYRLPFGNDMFEALKL